MKKYPYSEAEFERLQKLHGFKNDRKYFFKNRGFPKKYYEDLKESSKHQKEVFLKICELPYINSSKFNSFNFQKMYDLKKGKAKLYESEYKDFAREVSQLTNYLKKYIANPNAIQNLKDFLSDERIKKYTFFYYNQDYSKNQTDVIIKYLFDKNEILTQYQENLNLVLSLRLQELFI